MVFPTTRVACVDVPHDRASSQLSFFRPLASLVVSHHGIVQEALAQDTRSRSFPARSGLCCMVHHGALRGGGELSLSRCFQSAFVSSKARQD